MSTSVGPTERLISVLGAGSLLLPLGDSWGVIVQSRLLGLLTVALAAADLLLLLALATVETASAKRRLDRCLLLVGALVVGVVTVTTLWGHVRYGTDEAALTQGAANALLHGHDPYTSHLTGALTRYLEPSAYPTYSINGGFASGYDYPALPMLLVSAVLGITHHGPAVPITYAVILILGLVWIHRSLPASAKALAVIICVGLPGMLRGAVQGETQTLVTVLLLVVAVDWPRVGQASRLSRRDLVTATALGLAIAVNQVAWFVAPFVVTGISLVLAGTVGPRRALALIAQFIGIAALAFLAVNLPFIVWNPRAWADGVLAPLTQNAIPLGQGVIGITMFGRIGGGDLAAFNDAAAAALAGGLLVFCIYVRRLGRACFLLPITALFLAERSLDSYWLLLVPVVVLSVGADDGGRLGRAYDLEAWLAGRLPGRIRLSPVRVAALALVPACALIGLALTSPAPLRLRVLSATAASRQGRTNGLAVLASNNLDRSVTPRFAVNFDGQMTPFWRVASGPARLGPHETAVYRLMTPDGPAAVPRGRRFQMDAVTATPATLSSSLVSLVGRRRPDRDLEDDALSADRKVVGAQRYGHARAWRARRVVAVG